MIDRPDARGQVAMPGLSNCHTHAPMVTLRGVAEDVQTDEWERMPALLDRSRGKRIQEYPT